MSDVAINFRASDTFVIDGSGETYSLGYSVDPAYSVSDVMRGGAHFGWDGTVNDMGRDRDNAVDRRLAGVNQAENNGTQTVFRLDLPAAGAYDIALAIGDAANDQAYQYVQVLDDTSVLFTIDATSGTLAGHFLDANGTDWAAADWPGSNTTRSVTFTSTILNVKIGAPTAQANSTTLAHLRVTSAAAGAKMLAALGCG